MHLDYLILYLAIACFSQALPVKRGFFDDFFGLDKTTTAIVPAPTVAVAVAPVPETTVAAVAAADAVQTAVPAVTTVPAAVPTTTVPATTSSIGVFASWLNRIMGVTPTTTAQAAAATAAATAAPIVTATPAIVPTPATTSSVGFLQSLFNQIFGGSSATTAQEAPIAAPTIAPTPTISSAVNPQVAGAKPGTTISITVTVTTLHIPSAAVIGTQVSSAPAVAIDSQASSALGAIYTQTFQGGSPGKYTGSINTETATASNGGSSAAATAVIGSKGITYSPYTKADKCKTSSEVAADMAQLTSYDLIRLYSTDCSGIENVLASLSSHQQLYLGLWNIDTQSVKNGLQEIKNAIAGSSRGWSVVHTIAVGNERVNAGEATVAQMQNAVDTARQWLKSNAPDYNGYIVTVDTLVAYVSNPQLCQMSDYLAVNSHPYWDGGVEPSNSGPWLQQQISHLQSVCGTSKDVLITETGWPTQGDTFGTCVPSVPNQVAAVKSIVSTLGSKVIMFTMYNDYWKDPGPYNVEQHWGIYGDPSM